MDGIKNATVIILHDKQVTTIPESWSKYPRAISVNLHNGNGKSGIRHSKQPEGKGTRAARGGDLHHTWGHWMTDYQLTSPFTMWETGALAGGLPTSESIFCSGVERTRC